MAKALVALSTGEVLGKILTLITLAWVARAIGLESFGVFTFGMGLGVLLAAIPSLAPSSRMIQMVGRNIETVGVRLAAMTVLRLSFTLPAALLAIPFILMRSDHIDRWTIALLVASCLLDNTIKVWLAACTAIDRQPATAGVILAQRVLTLLFVAIALSTGPNSATVAASFALAALLANIMMNLLSRHYGAKPDFRNMTWQHVKEMLIAVPVVGGNSLLKEGLARIDVLLIGLLAGEIAVGIYGVAYRLMETALFVSWTLARSLTPELVRADNSHELGRPVRLGIVLMCALYLPYGMVLALEGNRLVELIFGPGYDVGNVLVSLSAAPLMFGLGHFASTTIFARNPDKIVPIATAVALIVNIAINAALLPVLESEAAALAKTAAFAIQALILYIAVLRFTRPRGAHRGITASVLATLVASIPLIFELPLIAGLLLAVALYLPTWFILSKKFDPWTTQWLKLLSG